MVAEQRKGSPLVGGGLQVGWDLGGLAQDPCGGDSLEKLPHQTGLQGALLVAGHDRLDCPVKRRVAHFSKHGQAPATQQQPSCNATGSAPWSLV